MKDLGLSARAISALATARIYTIGDLLQYGVERLEFLRACGALTVKEIKDVAFKDMPL